jgi:catechol 2,3-dioxygenase-like lactoylglutathione lyase family enzyme
MKLQVVVLPVEDVDRAKAFYRSIGFREIYDHSESVFRVVQLTPPGSEASIVFGTGVTDAAPGSIQGLVLVVRDITIARVDLTDRGVNVSGVFHDIGGVFYHVAPEYEVPGLDPARRDYRSYARFRDPDGNTWVLQEARHLARGAPPPPESREATSGPEEGSASST